jgi:PAS domain-containing protein
MPHPDWTKEFPCAITVCDADGVILDMNDASLETFRADGGAALLGTDVRACHPEPARAVLEGLLRDGSSNVYTIEKSGRKKLICQMPWYDAGRFAGLVEISIVLPDPMPHFKRD